MRLSEITAVSTADDEKIAIRRFILWCCKVLKLDHKTLPQIKFDHDREVAASKHRTGEFDGQSIIVYVGNRNMVDILRTVAHELAHHKQKEMDLIHSHGAGSGPEISADMVAGYLMKIYGAKHPEIYQ